MKDDDRAKENPPEAAGIVSSADHHRDDGGDNRMNNKDFTISGHKNVGWVVPAAEAGDETADPWVDDCHEPDTEDLSLEEQARLRRERREAEAVEREAVSPDRLHLLLRPIVRETRGDDLARYQKLKAFAQKHGLPLSEVRKAAKSIDKESDQQKQSSKRRSGT